jgi:5-methylcytosine-specific restriction endonuclease McrA
MLTGVYKKCLTCNKEIYVHLCEINTKRFCSQSCSGKYLAKNRDMGIYWRGKKRPEITGEKSPHWKGGDNRFKCFDCGKTLSHDSGYISNTKVRRCQKCFGVWERGENNPSWKGGISYDMKNYRRNDYKKYPEKYKLHNQKRHSRLKAGGKLTIKTIQMVYEDNIKKHGTLTCYLCLKPIAFKQDSLEHKIPLTRGGTNEYNNLAIAHGVCNSKKGCKTHEEYANGNT